MRRFVLIFISVFTLFSCNGKDEEIVFAERDNGSFEISGVVSDGGNPVEGVVISLTGKTFDSVSSEADGSFTISNLQKGVYYLEANKNGYFIFNDNRVNRLELTANRVVNFTALKYSDILAFDSDNSGVVDDSEKPNGQFTRIHSIQGKAHISPKKDTLVRNVVGIVTAFDGGTRLGGLYPSMGADIDGDSIGDFLDVYIQDMIWDDDDRTSEGIKLYVHKDFANGLALGDILYIREGFVVENDKNPDDYETNWDSMLSRTQINASIENNNIVRLFSGDNSNPILPDPVLIGAGGREVPYIICNDAYNNDLNDPRTIFDPEEDSIDLFESLEGMRVQINNAVSIGPSAYSEIVVLPDEGVKFDYLANRNGRGGYVVKDYENKVAGRIKVKGIEWPVAFDIATPDVFPGTVFEGAIIGVLDYSYGLYQIRATKIPGATNRSRDAEIGGLLNPLDPPLSPYRDSTTIESDSNTLTVASFNVENFVASGSEDNFSDNKIAGIAHAIVSDLRSPDIIGLIEVQDNSGNKIDGIVDCDNTIQILIDIINNANRIRRWRTKNQLITDGFTNDSGQWNDPINGVFVSGPDDYKFAQVNPVNMLEGGEPGGNIRCVFLYRSSRVEFVERAGATSINETYVTGENGEATISYSPGRLGNGNPAFNHSRRSLVGEFRFKYNDEKIYVIANHFKSKRGDSLDFGNIQPPIKGSEAKRIGQAECINSFCSEILSYEPDANIIVLGDMNDYHYSKTMKVLEGNELTNLYYLPGFPENERYSYIHDGLSQTLDHIFVSDNLLKKNPKLDVVHIHSEFVYIDYNLPPWSDHEPVLSSFDF